MSTAPLRWIPTLLVAGLLGLAGGPGCATQPPIAGTEQPMRFHNWWNYYERGVQRLAAGDYEGARADMETALGQRSGARFGYDEDAWRVRTYGMHFLNGYFPHRELGVALFHLGQHAQARRELETSVEQTPSGRAKYYLNLARARSAQPNAAPPSIEWTEDCELVWTHERNRPLRGQATAAGFVADVTIQGKREFIELAAARMPFERLMRLRPGTNAIDVTARDLAGRKTARRLTWVADWNPPGLTVLRADPGADGLRVQAIGYDDQALARICVDGRVVADVTAQAPRSIEVAFALPARGGRVDVVDRAGNTNTCNLSSDDIASLARPPVQWASAEEAGVADAGAAPSPGAYQPADRLKPALALSETRPVVAVVRDEFFLDGKAQDGGGLAHVFVNGEDLLPSELAGGRTPFYLARRLPLEPGTNIFEVAAVDQAGNHIVKTLTVVRSEPEFLREELRLRAALSPMRASADPGLAEQVRAMLETSLNTQPPRFALLERNEGLDLILQEQELSLSALADPAAALRIRKMQSAELLLFGQLQPHGDGTTVVVSVVETEEGRILFSEDVYSHDTVANLPDQVSGLARKIEQRFPLSSGRIERLKGREAEIAISDGQRADARTRFVVYRASDADESSFGQVRREGDQPVELVVTRGDAGRGQALIQPETGSRQLREGDHVYAR